MDGPAPKGGSERQVRMAKYYSTNALYEYIQQQELTQFRFAKENIWIMLYGTGESVPKLLLVISAVRGEDYRGRCLTQHEQEIMELAGVLAGRSGLPYRVVRYRLGEERLEEVQYIDYLSGQCAELPIGRLRRLFAQNGLPVIQEGTAKDLNDRASSPFHNWQRAALGRELTASDLDLIRFEPQGGRDVIYELKRSFFPWNSGSPTGETTLISGFFGASRIWREWIFALCTTRGRSSPFWTTSAACGSFPSSLRRTGRRMRGS